MRRFQILNKDKDKVVSLLKKGGKVTNDVLPDVTWAHKAPLKLVRMKHGKIHLFAEEAGAWKQVISVDDRDTFLRDALLNASSDVPLTRDNGYYILQKRTIGVSRRAFMDFIQRQQALQVTRNVPKKMTHPGRPLESRGYLEMDLIEAKGKDFTKIIGYTRDFYFFTVIDRLTGWIEVEIMYNKEMKTSVKALEKMLKRMKKALKADIKYMRSDAGSEFKSDVIQLLKDQNIRQRFVRSGARIEKANQDLQRIFYRLLRLGRGDDIQQLLNQSVAILNNTRSKVTGVPPIEALDLPDEALRKNYNKHRAKLARYTAPELQPGDKVRYTLHKVIGKHKRAMGYKAYRGYHWSPVVTVVKINRKMPPAKFYVDGKWRYRDELMRVLPEDEETNKQVKAAIKRRREQRPM